MLIRRMARENPLWGQERIAYELLLKLAIRVSPRTVAKYMPKPQPGRPRGDQRWSTFLKNHAKAIVACDFFVSVTATFRVLYVFIVIEHGRRRLAHVNVTASPTADWTLQQLREVVGDEGVHRYLIHDRDRIFAKHLDDSIRALGIEVLRSPLTSPKANAICEGVIGTIRRECLDPVPTLLAFLMMTFSGWVRRRQLIVIEFLNAENPMLKERLWGKRIRFADAERVRFYERTARRSAIHKQQTPEPVCLHHRI
jgi:hypothetical protein